MLWVIIASLGKYQGLFRKRVFSIAGLRSATHEVYLGIGNGNLHLTLAKGNGGRALGHGSDTGGQRNGFSARQASCVLGSGTCFKHHLILVGGIQCFRVPGMVQTSR